MTPEEIAELRRQKYNATVLRLMKVHSDLMVLRVRPDFQRPPHKAGQYSVLGLGLERGVDPEVDDSDGGRHGRLVGPAGRELLAA